MPGDSANGAKRPPKKQAFRPGDIIDRWRAEGPLVRVPTGIEPLDRMCRGGLPIPWRVVIVGAPAAGKTAVDTVVADNLASEASEAGLCVGVLAIDEEPDDITIRLLQIAGFTVAQAELRDPEQLAEMTRALEQHRIRLYDAEWSIPSAAKDLAEWARAESRNAALFIDSIQTASSGFEFTKEPSAREVVEANMRAVRRAATHHRLLVVATSEANRNAYRSSAAADDSDDMASGAESRAIEFCAQTMLMLRTPKDHADVIAVNVRKNRRSDVGRFWLRLDRDRHTVTECHDPTEDPAAAHREEERQKETNRGAVERDARALAEVVRRNPGVTERDLRAAVRTAGHRWGRERLDAARRQLAEATAGVRLVNRSDGTDRAWYVEPVCE